MIKLPNDAQLVPVNDVIGGRSLGARLSWPPDTALYPDDLSRFAYLNVDYQNSGDGLRELLPILPFIHENPTLGKPELRRGIKSESRVLVRKRGNSIVPNEFLIETNDPESQALKPLSHLCLELLAQRRSLLFVPTFAERVYNVMFPAGILSREADKCGYIAIPWITLIRVSYTSRCRHTVEFQSDACSDY